MLRDSLIIQILIKRTCVLIQFSRKVLVYGTYCLLWTNLLFVFRFSNYVWKRFTRTQNRTVAIYVTVIPVVHRCGAECAWVIVSWTWPSALIVCAHVVPMYQRESTRCTLHSAFCAELFVCKIDVDEKRPAKYTAKCNVRSCNFRCLDFAQP